MRIRLVRLSRRFERDFKSLPRDVQRAAEAAIRGLCEDPIPQRRRAHRLNGHLPPIYVVDVFTNHSWQITYHLDGDVAILLRVAAHAVIDRKPG